MHASRANAILKLWNLVHTGRPVLVEREKAEGGKARGPKTGAPEASEAGHSAPLASATGS